MPSLKELNQKLRQANKSPISGDLLPASARRLTDRLISELSAMVTSEMADLVKSIPPDRMDEVLRAIERIKIPAPVVSAPAVDLSPVVQAVTRLERSIDVSSVRKAVERLETQVGAASVQETKSAKPRTWKMVHERDSRGRIWRTKVTEET